jgi:protein O-mannosyl-transferase
LNRSSNWWIWITLAVGLLVAFDVFSPAIGGPFVWDDRGLPFSNPDLQNQGLLAWVGGNRPLLMFTFWVNYQMGAENPVGYHMLNFLLHFTTAVLIVLILASLLERAGVQGNRRVVLSVFGGALFLLHPLQTESVSYIASRSEVLSVALYFAAYTVFLLRPQGAVRLVRMVVIGLLAGLALATKEHTLTIVALMMLTDLYWNPKKLRENAVMYGLAGLAGALGGAYVLRILHASQSAGFSLAGLTPAEYFFTQCRVVWRYIRLFFVPIGQNLDTDYRLSSSILDHGAILGLVALLVLGAAAWFFRKRWPLASFGIFTFLLLLAPTSSVIPITDVVAEHRMYLPLIGLVLVCLELLRLLPISRIVGIGAVVLVICAAFTYRRNELWSSPIAIWQDTIEKSPAKVRPRFQLGLAYYEMGQCAPAAENFATAARLDRRPSLGLLLNLGVSLGCSGHAEDGLKVLADAQRLNPNYDMTYVYRGDIYAAQGDEASAADQYQHALALNPGNGAARASLRQIHSGRTKRRE